MISYEAIKQITAADVYKGDRFAAQLVRRDGTIEFRYRDEYLAEGGLPIASTLHLTDEPTVSVGGSVPPFFAGLLPEGRRLSSLRRAIKTSADDELSFLLAIGSDTVGDVRVVPAATEPWVPTEAIEVDRSWDEVSFADLLRDAGVLDRIGIPGVQEKASARMISVPVKQAAARWILKVDPPEYPLVVINEAFFARVAKAAGLPVAESSVVYDSEGMPGLLVRRFDRVTDSNGAMIRLAVEDSCQALGRWPADKYNVSAEAVVECLASLCGSPAVGRRDLYRQFAFAWLTGNGDAHAKNFSVLRELNGEVRISPAYDLPSTVPYNDSTFALAIAGRTKELSRRLFLDFASSIGLSARAAISVLNEILERTAGLEEQLREGALPFPQNRNADLVAQIRHRRHLLREPA